MWPKLVTPVSTGDTRRQSSEKPVAGQVEHCWRSVVGFAGQEPRSVKVAIEKERRVEEVEKRVKRAETLINIRFQTTRKTGQQQVLRSGSVLCPRKFLLCCGWGR